MTSTTPVDRPAVDRPPAGSPGREPGDPRLGTVIERYRLLDVLGSGGMGVVYRAEHTALQRTVALKLLRPGLGQLHDMDRRFEREAVAAGRLDHPNCVAVVDFGQLADGCLFLVMELAEGRTLRQLLSECRQLAPRRALHIARHVLRGLAHAHGLGVVHRDIKPDNVMLVRRDDDEDFARILDFGIAKLVGGEAETGPALTRTGVAIGTPQYIAPEQILGGNIDHRVDLYSTTVMLYELIAGRGPFAASDSIALIGQHLAVEPAPLGQLCPGLPVPAGLEELLARGLAKQPDQRIASAVAYLEALEAVLAAPDTLPAHPVAVPAPPTAQLPATGTAVLATAATTAVPVARPTGAVPAATAVSWRRPGSWPRRRWLWTGAALLAVLFLLSRLGAPGRDERLAQLLDRLQNAASCEERREAVLGLHALGDPRAVPHLRKARYRGEGGLVFGIGARNANRCLRKEADEAIEALEALEARR
jgi:serine/threonine-protein kinase